MMVDYEGGDGGGEEGDGGDGDERGGGCGDVGDHCFWR